MWENAAQMHIVSLNWWQYAGWVWSHANSAQQPNSHLAPKLKINTAHWNNSLHIGGTGYFPSDLYITTLVARVPASSGQKSPDTTRHALDQGPHPSWPNCSPRLADSIVYFSHSGRGVIHVSDQDWSQTCSIGFISGLPAGQSMTSTFYWSKKAAVSRAVWGGALSWT